MKLLILIHSLQSGGAERVSASMANHWEEAGWTVTVLTLTSNARDFYKVNAGVQRVALNVAGDSRNALSAVNNNFQRVRAIRRELKKREPDVAVAMMSTANILLALAAIGLKGVRIIGSERTYPPRIPLGRAWEAMRAYLYGQLDTVVALTQESASWLHQHTRAREVAVIPNAVTWPLPIHDPYLPTPDRTDGSHILLAVGRMSEEKGFDLLIRAFHALAPDFPTWRLVILGDGVDRQALEAQTVLTGLESRISLPGRSGNVGQWYAAADLYALTSRFEGFPNTLIEAMSYGLPVVSFDCDTGPRDIIRHEIDGLLVPAGNGAALEHSLRRLMENKALRDQFGAKANEVKQRFSIESVSKMWENYFGLES
ncbi:glycosyltransferase family 4 protein [Variovorax guangxiensis]|uniref:Glycosyltransferase family 4 protein n=1 Tax=Variovorax guangxiensis TaxID=1775474 RepID=A0A502DKY0_9BURK|nr:glycosyltransferase family 4 protein [Variovorax guangxiensis]TPG20756.1 glycosyltransferase family 4 protein [Variovorax ginsengisoli]TPG26085.1 glycosyltransferase family 4 protein [Variovorax guangxiensis]